MFCFHYLVNLNMISRNMLVHVFWLDSRMIYVLSLGFRWSKLEIWICCDDRCGVELMISQLICWFMSFYELLNFPALFASINVLFANLREKRDVPDDIMYITLALFLIIRKYRGWEWGIPFKCHFFVNDLVSSFFGNRLCTFGNERGRWYGLVNII